MNPADSVARRAVVTLALCTLVCGACGPQRPLGVLLGGPLGGEVVETPR